jgi:ArsR family metal-binding transcriptional regulator
MKYIKSINNEMHIEKCKNVKESIKYCQKEETRIEGPW